MRTDLSTLLVTSFAMMLVSLCGGVASADHLEDFTINQTALFRFGAFDETNSFFDGEGLQLDIAPVGTSNFGGIGIAPLVSSVNLDNLTAIEVTARLNAGNASDLILAIREDNGSGGDGEFFSFAISPDALTEGSFVTVSIDPTSFFFNGDSTDGVLNGELNNTGFQPPFGTNNQLSYTIRSVNYVGATAVPEPTAASLLAFAGVGLLAQRRRKR